MVLYAKGDHNLDVEMLLHLIPAFEEYIPWKTIIVRPSELKENYIGATSVFMIRLIALLMFLWI